MRMWHYRYYRKDRFLVSINLVLIVAAVIYGLIFQGLALYDTLALGITFDPYGLITLLSAMPFVIIIALVRRGFDDMASALWLLSVFWLAVGHTLIAPVIYQDVMFAMMTMIIIGAGFLTNRYTVYVTGVVVTLYEVFVVLFTPVDLTIGSITALVMVNVVVTLLMLSIQRDRGLLNQANDRLSAILQGSPDAILVLNSDGRIAATNTAFKALVNPQEERWYEGKSPTELLVESYIPTMHTLIESAIEEQATVRAEAQIVSRGQGVLDVEVAIAPIHHSDPAELVMTIRDITGLKAADRAKDAVVASITHELRTPITSLKLYHRLLAQNPARATKYLDMLNRETERLQSIIEGMLAIALLERADTFEGVETVSLNAIATQLVSDREPVAARKQISLALGQLDAKAYVHGVPHLVDQVVGELLTNALNYTPAGGEVHIKTYCNGTEACICVSDTGEGIPAEDVPHLFERFYRGEAARKSGKPGTGLGLAIARSIVEQLEGRIEVDSEPGQGTTFSVWLPIAKG